MGFNSGFKGLKLLYFYISTKNIVVPSANICAQRIVMARSTTCSAVSNPIRGTDVCTSIVAMLSFPVQVGGLQWAAPGGKRVQKIRYVLTVNRNRKEGLWKVKRQKIRENKDTWKHQNF